MIKNVDFDKLFDDFLNAYLAETLGKVKPEVIEKEIPAKYVEWMCTPCKELEGKTPHQFIEDLKSSGKLGEYLLSYVEADQDISDIIAEACGESEVDVLVEIMRNYPDYACPACAILKDISSTKADKVILDIVLNPESSDVLVDMAIEMLSDGTHPNIVDDVLAVIDDMDEKTQKNLVDIIYVYKGNERVYEWIVKMFRMEEGNKALYCAYLGSYDNPDAIDLLLEYAENSVMDYYEFMELRNAVERLGGEMDKNVKYQVVKGGI